MGGWVQNVDSEDNKIFNWGEDAGLWLTGCRNERSVAVASGSQGDNN